MRRNSRPPNARSTPRRVGVHLAMAAQHPVTVHAQRGVVAPIPLGFAETEAHHHVRCQHHDLADVRMRRRAEVRAATRSDGFASRRGSRRALRQEVPASDAQTGGRARSAWRPAPGRSRDHARTSPATTQTESPPSQLACGSRSSSPSRTPQQSCSGGLGQLCCGVEQELVTGLAPAAGRSGTG